MAILRPSKPLSLVFIRTMASVVPVKRQTLSHNFSFAPVSPVTLKKEGSTWIMEGEKRGLALVLEYMNAQPKHVDKFIEFYHKRNMHVLTVNLKPWQLFLPARGSQVVAKELANFLLTNKSFEPIVYHGFSVGGYLWGELVRLCVDRPEKYHSVIDRVCARVLDSGVDVTEIPTAFPRAVLPHNPVLRSTMEAFIRFHMKTFYNDSTRHYIAAREAFSHGDVRSPLLLLYSDGDPLSTPQVNRALQQDTALHNVPVTMKQFSGTKHVMHFQKYREEYLKQLVAFLDNIDLKVTQDNTHLQSKL